MPSPSVSAADLLTQPAAPAAPSVTETALKAALWDMDGTLVDTEPYWIEAETALIHAHGGSWDKDKALQLVGKALEDSARIIQQAGVDLSVRGIVDHLSASVVRRVREHVPWRPGARELLAELHGRGVRCVLVTMSEHALAAEVAGALGAPYFEFLVTGDQVANGKPHPEPYLTAVERLQAADPGLTAQHCVALEDSVPGVTSALAANVPTIGIPHIVPLPADPARTTWHTLAGRTYDDVARVVRERAGTAGGAL